MMDIHDQMQLAAYVLWCFISQPQQDGAISPSTSQIVCENMPIHQSALEGAWCAF